MNISAWARSRGTVCSSLPYRSWWHSTTPAPDEAYMHPLLGLRHCESKSQSLPIHGAIVVSDAVGAAIQPVSRFRSECDIKRKSDFSP